MGVKSKKMITTVRDNVKLKWGLEKLMIHSKDTQIYLLECSAAGIHLEN